MRHGTCWDHVFAFILGTGDKYRSWFLTTEDDFVSPGTSLRIAKHKKTSSIVTEETRDVRVPTTHCLPLRFLLPRVTDLAEMSVYIFLTTFFPRIPQSTHFSPSFVIFLSYGHAYRAFSLRFSLFPSFSELPRNACAFHPEKWIFSFGKKSEKSADSLHEARGGSLLVRGRKRSDAERTNVGQNRENGRTEGCWRKGSRRGRGERRERESRVKQRRSRRENENHASAYEERGWNWGRERCLSRKVEILGGARERDGEREQSVPLLCAFRTSGEQKAPRIL